MPIERIECATVRVDAAIRLSVEALGLELRGRAAGAGASMGLLADPDGDVLVLSGA